MGRCTELKSVEGAWELEDLSDGRARRTAPQDQLLRDFESAQEEQRTSMWELAALEDVDALLTPGPGAADRRSAVLAAARPAKGTGTPFAFAVSGAFVPTNASLFFLGSFVLFVGSLRPATGDQDLLLPVYPRPGPPCPRAG